MMSKKYKVLDLQEYKAGIGTSTKPMWKDLELETGELWDKVYGENYLNWWHPDSKSGEGTVKEADRRIKVINDIIKDYNIESILDLGCGDLYWAEKLDLDKIKRYAGVDISKVCVGENLYKETDTLEIYQCDITDPNDNYRFHSPRTTKYPKNEWDLVMMFDILNHCIQEEIDEIVDFLIKSNVKYVLTNNFSLKRMEFENKEFKNTPEETGVWWPGHWDGKTKEVRNMPINIELHPKWKWKTIKSDEEYHLTDTKTNQGQLPQGNECLDLYKINE